MRQPHRHTPAAVGFRAEVGVPLASDVELSHQRGVVTELSHLGVVDDVTPVERLMQLRIREMRSSP